jgi:hypothetical protein
MGDLVLKGATSGQITLTPTAIAGTNTLTVPAETGTIITSATSTRIISAAAVPAGSVVQVVNYQTGAVATGSTTIPFDDTIPQNTEGNEFMTLAITPKSATNKLRIDAIGYFTVPSGSYYFTMALFQDTTANALASATFTPVTNFGGLPFVLPLTYYMTSGTTSSTTFKIRAGSSFSQTTTFNGAGGSRYYGGSLSSCITITEIAG